MGTTTTDETAILTNTLLTNTLAIAEIRLAAAEAARTALGETSAAAKAALEEAAAIRAIMDATTARIAADGVSMQTADALAALRFDDDGVIVDTGGTGGTVLGAATMDGTGENRHSVGQLRSGAYGVGSRPRIRC